jgi:hypothetical protein
MDETKVLLAPDLGVDADAFAAEWNRTPGCHEKAQARATQEVPQTFGPGLAAVGLAVATGVAGSALYDLIKLVLGKLLAARGQAAGAEVRPVPNPTGGELLLVTKSAPQGQVPS